MKMVEVITGLRALTPDLRAHVDELLSRVQEANNLSSDAKNCVSREAMRALILPLSAALSQLAYTAMSVDAASARLEALVNGYTRQFKEESGAPVDDPRQPDLPGVDIKIGPASVPMTETTAKIDTTPVPVTETVVKTATVPVTKTMVKTVPISMVEKAVTTAVRAVDDEEDPEG